MPRHRLHPPLSDEGDQEDVDGGEGGYESSPEDRVGYYRKNVDMLWNGNLKQIII